MPPGFPSSDQQPVVAGTIIIEASNLLLLLDGRGSLRSQNLVPAEIHPFRAHIPDLDDRNYPILRRRSLCDDKTRPLMGLDPPERSVRRHLYVLEPSGACDPALTSLLRTISKSVGLPGIQDSTVYGTSRASTRSFY